MAARKLFYPEVPKLRWAFCLHCRRELALNPGNEIPIHLIGPGAIYDDYCPGSGLVLVKFEAEAYHCDSYGVADGCQREQHWNITRVWHDAVVRLPLSGYRQDIS